MNSLSLSALAGQLVYIFMALEGVLVLVGVAGIRAVAMGSRRLLAELEEARLEAGKSNGTQYSFKDPGVDAAVQRRREGRGSNAASLAERALMELQAAPARGRLIAWVRVVRMTISVPVIIGLVGTFAGLIVLLMSLSTNITTAVQEGADPAAVLTQLNGLLIDLRWAFLPSVCGAGISGLLTVASALAGTFHAPERLLAELNEYLSHWVPDESKITVQAMDQGMSKLSGTMKSGIVEIGEGIKTGLKSLDEAFDKVKPLNQSLDKYSDNVKSMGTQITQAAKKIQEASEALGKTQKDLPQRLGEMGEINKSLAGVIERMNEALAVMHNQQDQTAGRLTDLKAAVDSLDRSLQEFHKQWPLFLTELGQQTQTIAMEQAASVSGGMEAIRVLLAGIKENNAKQFESLFMEIEERLGRMRMLQGQNTPRE